MSTPTPLPATPPEGPAPPRRPRVTEASVARWIATLCGLGRIPRAPGTWGSLVGVALAWLFARAEFEAFGTDTLHFYPFNPIFWWLVLSALGVWSAAQVAAATGRSDPQEVVIDEVSGQWLALLVSPYFLSVAANWKSSLAGLILFRVFDIWKPFPVDRAESLPGGWGIMADDWVAGLYAAGCLWLVHGIAF
jgi:phosphatidylglycerophosphatase A